MIKTVLLLLVLLATVFASSSELRVLQEAFHEEVILDNIYRKQFPIHFSQSCSINNSRCQKKVLEELKKKVSLEDDRKLKAHYRKRMKKIFVSEAYWLRLEKYLQDKKYLFDHSQFVTFIDLSKQWLMILLWVEEHHAFYLIGNDLISSGNIEKEGNVVPGEDHYLKTPSGIFQIKSGWRSKGLTLTDSITMPYGQKGRFIFYFGKQKSVRYDTFDNNGSKISDPTMWFKIEDELAFAIHAHKSSTFFGKPFSHGCIRMSNELNLFLDNNLVLHKKVLDGINWISTSANPPKDPRNYDLAGEYLIIADEI